MSTIDPSPLYTVSEAARFLHLSMVTVRRMTSDGRLPVVRIGKNVRIRRDDLNQLVEISSPRPPLLRNKE